ncbi:MAG: DNA cytosine methyltransferase [Bacteroidetes bacterium]|nr:DNA cytosine methyltransferase [Bacteroidota bacterium]
MKVTQHSKDISHPTRITAVDLFCGVGGLSYGLLSEGIEVVAGIDIDEQCEFAYTNNVKAAFIKKSVARTKAEEIEKLYPEDSVKVLVGCAPCQPFSQYTNTGKKNRRKTTPKTDQWKLLREFIRLIKELQPEVVSMENVPQLEKYPIYDEFIEGLKGIGYHVSARQVYCPDYGIPQTRTRLVLLASKLGPIALVEPTHEEDNYRTVRDAIGNLPKISAGEICETDSFHRARKLSELNLKRIKKSKAGGTWHDWPEDLKLECHKRDSGGTYASVYGRMVWDDPSPTMTTHCCGLGNGRFGHPEQHRAISLREAALLQTFPANYKFESEEHTLSQKVLCRQIGNAVPVRLGSVIGRSIVEHVQESI